MDMTLRTTAVFIRATARWTILLSFSMPPTRTDYEWSPSWCSTTPPISTRGSRKRGARATTPRRDWYVWSDTDDRYAGVRIIFVDTERSNWAWDADSKQYYWHRFFSHQPDLNYDNPLVREEMWNVMKFWLDLGVDGFRVDAVPYLIEREGTSCENLPETHEVLKFLRARLNEHFTGPDVAGGSQSVARRCASLLRRW